jgi:hypothetical protein
MNVSHAKAGFVRDKIGDAKKNALDAKIFYLFQKIKQIIQ